MRIILLYACYTTYTKVEFGEIEMELIMNKPT